MYQPKCTFMYCSWYCSCHDYSFFVSLASACDFFCIFRCPHIQGPIAAQDPCCLPAGLQVMGHGPTELMFQNISLIMFCMLCIICHPFWDILLKIISSSNFLILCQPVHQLINPNPPRCWKSQSICCQKIRAPSQSDWCRVLKRWDKQLNWSKFGCE